MSHARSAWWRQIELYAPRRTPSRHSIRSTRLSDTTACFRFCCSVSALASPPRILFCLAGIFSFFILYGGGGRGRCSQKEKRPEFKVAIQWTRFCLNFFFGDFFLEKPRLHFPPAFIPQTPF